MSQGSNYQGYNGKHSHGSVNVVGWQPGGGVAIVPVAALEGHVVGHASDAQLQHLAAVGFQHTAPGPQDTVVPVPSVPLEAQLIKWALDLDQLKWDFLLQDGAVVAMQVVTQCLAGEKMEAQHGDGQELHHVGAAGQRKACHISLILNKTSNHYEGCSNWWCSLCS